VPVASPLPLDAEVDLEAALADLDQQGFARLGRVVGDEVLAGLRERADDLMFGRLRIDGLFFQADSPTGRYADLDFGRGWVGPTTTYRKLEKLERDDRFRALIASSTFERIVRARIAGPVAIYRAVLFNKAPSGGTELPWHQDGGRFWGVDRDPTLQLWTALDDVPAAAGCLEVVPGSHRGGLATPDGGNVPADLLAAAGADARAVLLPAVAGEVILLHNHLWHRSARNRDGRPRRALTVCYMSAATRCLRRKRAPRVFFRPFDDRG
jgi:phytanoyl-CoA hydroxylase